VTHFGRFECGKKKPVETYVGDRMVLERGYVKILRGIHPFAEPEVEVIAVLHLTGGQSVRAIPPKRTKPKAKKRRK
jgi:hypothetical protein